MAGHGGDDGHGHHPGGSGPCSCEHDHDDDDTLERGTLFSLYLKIDTERVRCLNEAHDGSAKSIFKPWHERLEKERVSLIFCSVCCYKHYYGTGTFSHHMRIRRVRVGLGLGWLWCENGLHPTITVGKSSESVQLPNFAQGRDSWWAKKGTVIILGPVYRKKGYSFFLGLNSYVDVSIAVIVILISVPALMVTITVSITVQFLIQYLISLCIRDAYEGRKKLEEVIGPVIAIVCALLWEIERNLSVIIV